MGFLDKLWDETLAGPAPETGLGRFRKYNSFSAVRSPNHPIANAASRYRDHDHDHHLHDQTVSVSRSITILRPNNLSVDPGSGSSTPSTGPSSPYTPGAVRDPDVKRFSRKKPAFDPMEHDVTTGPSVYDWIMIGALDR